MSIKGRKIEWWTPRLGNQEKKFINQVFKSHFPNEGQLTASFEAKIAQLVGARYAVAVTSGTSAIFLALKSLGIKSGDEVIIPDITFIATVNAVEMTGAKPILVDIDPQTLNISTAEILKALTPKTKAIVPVHVSGRAAAMEKILAIAKKRNIFVVEDAAECLCSKYHGEYLGTWSDAGCFSFSPNKTITTGQGGMIVTDRKDIYQRLKELKDQGRPFRGTGGDDMHPAIGYNFKFTDIQAAIGLGQLTYLQERLQRMVIIHREYQRYLSGMEGLRLFPFDLSDGEIPQWTDVCLEKRDALDSYLKKHEIYCRRYWFPIHTQAPYKMSDDRFPQSTSLSPQALWLPSAFTMTKKDVKVICDHIKNFFKKQ